MPAVDKKIFHFVIIKPSHYDDNGYVIQWARSWIPSNTLATLYGLAMDCAERQILGEDVEIVLNSYDETNTRINMNKITAMINESGGNGLVGIVGVQTNQYPRALDIARQFREKNIQVCIGGFHVSGCLAMLPDITPDLQEAIDLGICLYAGEAEGRLDMLLQTAYRKELLSVYNFMTDLPELADTPVPYLPAKHLRGTASALTSFDAGRGCPFLCSFCTIINVQGRKSRHRSADDVEQIIRANSKQGIDNFFISDDNFSRNVIWEAIFDRLIKLREEEGFEFELAIQVDTMCHKIPGFIEKAGRAGTGRVFIGLENINPRALTGAGKGQNRITEYRAMMQAWQKIGVTSFAGYILGFPGDSPDSITRDIAIIQQELPIDLLEFFILTPLPGSADHKQLFENDVTMEADLNSYDTEHVCTAHDIMSDVEWLDIYKKAWELYYTPEHVETLIRRAKARGSRTSSMMNKLLLFSACVRLEKIHPLQGGFIRRRYRNDRRHGLPRENLISFYGHNLWHNISVYSKLVLLYMQYFIICKRVEWDSTPYTDLAIKSMHNNRLEYLHIFTETSGGMNTLVTAKRKAAAREAKAESIFQPKPRGVSMDTYKDISG